MGWFGSKKEERKVEVKLPELPPANSPPQDNLPTPQPPQSPIVPPPTLPREDARFKELSPINPPQTEESNQLSKTQSGPYIEPPPETQVIKDYIEKDKSAFSESQYNIIEPPPAKNPSKRIEVLESVSLPKEIELKKLTRPEEAIYVRLDKFEETVKAIENIKEKINEIEHVLNKIKEKKEEEQRELDEWEKELQIMKSRLEFIDKGVFEKFDDYLE